MPLRNRWDDSSFWATSIGAMNIRRAPLDFRLRCPKYLYKNVLSQHFLCQLTQSMNDQNSFLFSLSALAMLVIMRTLALLPQAAYAIYNYHVVTLIQLLTLDAPLPHAIPLIVQIHHTKDYLERNSLIFTVITSKMLEHGLKPLKIGSISPRLPINTKLLALLRNSKVLQDNGFRI